MNPCLKFEFVKDYILAKISIILVLRILMNHTFYLCNNTNYDMWLIRNKPNICTHAGKSSAKIKCKTTIM